MKNHLFSNNVYQKVIAIVLIVLLIINNFQAATIYAQNSSASNTPTSNTPASSAPASFNLTGYVYGKNTSGNGDLLSDVCVFYKKESDSDYKMIATTGNDGAFSVTLTGNTRYDLQFVHNSYQTQHTVYTCNEQQPTDPLRVYMENKEKDTSFQFEGLPSTYNLLKGKTETLTVNVTCQDKNTSNITYTVDNTDIAEFDKTNKNQLLIKKTGTITITATKPMTDHYTETAISQKLTIQNAVLGAMAFSQSSYNISFTKAEDTFQPQFSENSILNDGNISYSIVENNTSAVGEINPSTGAVTIKHPGSLTIQARKSAPGYNDVIATCKLNIAKGKRTIILSGNDSVNFKAVPDAKTPTYDVTCKEDAYSLSCTDQYGQAVSATYALKPSSEEVDVSIKDTALTVKEGSKNVELLITYGETEDYEKGQTTVILHLKKRSFSTDAFQYGQTPVITYDAKQPTYINPLKDKRLTSGSASLTYQIVKETIDGNDTVSGEIADINAITGELTIKRSGRIVVKVSRPETRSDYAFSATYTLTVEKAEQTPLKITSDSFSLITSDSTHYQAQVIYNAKDAYKLLVSGGSGTGNVTCKISDKQYASAQLTDNNVFFKTHKAHTFTMQLTKEGDGQYKETSTIIVFSVAKAQQPSFTLKNGRQPEITYNADRPVYQNPVFYEDETIEDEVKNAPAKYEIIRETSLEDTSTALQTGTVATIKNAQTGDLEIKRSGIVTVRVTKAGTDNYLPITAEKGSIYTLTIKRASQKPLQFSSDEIAVKNASSDQKTVSQSVMTTLGSTYHLHINGGNGKGQLKYNVNYDTFHAYIADNNLTITIREIYNPNTHKITVYKEQDDCYLASDTTELDIQTMTEPVPDIPYTIHGKKSETGWYNEGSVSISPASGYQINTDGNIDSEWTDSYELTLDANTEEQTIYLQNKTTKGITSAIVIPAKEILIDKTAPEELTLTYDRSPVNSILENITFGYYNAPVYATISARDTTSGLDHFTYSYQVDEKASKINKGKENVTVKLDGKNSYTFEIPPQFKGKVKFEAYDKAGNKSTYTDDENGIVIDDLAPSVKIHYSGTKADNVNEQRASVKEYNTNTRLVYNSNVTAEITVQEANFTPDLMTAYAVKDGNRLEYIKQSDWEQIADDTYRKTFTFIEDGNYQFYVSGKDYSEQQIDWDSEEYDEKTGTYQYVSNPFTIDKTAPVISVNYDKNTPVKENLYNTPRIATIRVIDRNFRPENVTLSALQAVDGNGTTIAEFQSDTILQYLHTWDAWKKVSVLNDSTEIWESTISFQEDAHYTFAVTCTDIANNQAADTCQADFYVDCTAPKADTMKITYSTPVLEKVLNLITFGYYQSSVTVTLQADDTIAGVEQFTWNYQKEADASSTNILTEGATIPVTRVNGLTSYASFVLSSQEAKQYRGHISFTATDKLGNTSALCEDNASVLVVDHIAPKCQVTYNEPAQSIKKGTDTTHYYSTNVTALLSITETNFYAEDVVVKVNGKKASFDGQWKQKGDVWNNTLTLKNSGDYVLDIDYKDRSDNQMKHYSSDTLVIDKEKPVISVTYNDITPVKTVEGRKYYNEAQKATIVIREHNFNAKDVQAAVLAEDVTGKAISIMDYNAYLQKEENWKKKGDTYTAEIPFHKDANYTFSITCTDLALQQAPDLEDEEFTVDKTVPQNLSITYSTSILEQILQHISFGYYKAKATVTIKAEDTISPIDTFRYSYHKEASSSNINSELEDAQINADSIKYSATQGTATATFDVPQNTTGAKNQFNGTISFTAVDMASNETSFDDGKHLVVDTIAPTAEVTYNTPHFTENGKAYYSEAVNAAIQITEANFDSNDVLVHVTKDGLDYHPVVSWKNESTDLHTGSLTLAEEGDYRITVNYRDKSSNEMSEYVSEELVVDTLIDAPQVTMNGKDCNGMAYASDAVLDIAFADTNFADYKISLSKTTMTGEVQDVTETFIKGLKMTKEGGKGHFDTFSKIQENDGIYHLTVTMHDKSGNEAVKETSFTLNRFGSVYVYNNYLTSIQEQYIQGVTNDLVITEYNPTALVADSVMVNITCDGKPVETPSVEITEKENTLAQNENGWHQYEYRILNSNFSTDGVYKIVVSSKDKAGNNPENAATEEQKIHFSVDTHAPEITSITGLEEPVINAHNIQVGYEVFDAIGLKSIRVLVDDEEIDYITDFSSDGNTYQGNFEIKESNVSRKVRLVAEDLAGNIADTNSKTFGSAYHFQPEVTVSTNAWIRWYANKPLVAATIAGCITAAGIVTAGVRTWKRKKLKNK